MKRKKNLIILSLLSIFMLNISSVKAEYNIPNQKEDETQSESSKIGICEYVKPSENPVNKNDTNIVKASDEPDHLYLSDIPYLSGTVGWGNVLYDKTSNNTLIAVKVDGTYLSFKKGVFAHATSTLVYDISEYNYDYFTAYLGLSNSSSGGNGVKYSIYTSQDNVNWTLVDCGIPEVQLPTDNATFVKANIKGAKYLKLVAHDNGSNGHDHSVYADAKLIKEGYTDNVTRTLDEFDTLINAKYDGTNINEELELLILQRELVRRTGNYQLRTLIEEGPEYQETFNWLFNDLEMLRLYLIGGNPDGTYLNSLMVLTNLYQSYKNDLTAEGVTARGVKYSDIYKKMMISLSLTHSKTVSFWISSSTGPGVTFDKNPNVSDAKDRYDIFKTLVTQNKLNGVFDNLEVEEMRMVMSSFINDDEIIWARDYAASKGNSVSGYQYMSYKNVNTALYRNAMYYGDNRKNYETAYKLTGYDVKNIEYFPRLWIVMNVGGVCWQISNMGQSMSSAMGIPSVVVGQPGHSAYLVYSTNNQGKGLWNIWNDVYGWTKSNLSAYAGSKGYYTIRLLNGWGNTKYASGNAGSYILLGEAALNDYDNYVKASEYNYMANMYPNDKNKQEEYYNKAIEAQSFNLDAWIGLVNIYTSGTKSDSQIYSLAERITTNLKYYPLPMYDLLNALRNSITSPAYLASYDTLEKNTLKIATSANDNNVLQSNITRTMANFLLGYVDNTVAKFSFDGEEAGVLSLAEKYSTTNATWEYSLDNMVNWTTVDAKSIKLTPEELASINTIDDIKVHILGVGYSENNIFTIDITKNASPTGLYNNEWENKVIGANDNFEWSLDNGATWTSYSTSHPDLTGNKTVLVRNPNTGTKVASDSISLTFTDFGDNEFTEENEIDLVHKYISITNLSIDYNKAAPSTELYETTGQKRDGRAINAIDGNINTYWHTAINGSDTENYIIIKLNNPLYVSRLNYIRKAGYAYGAIKTGTVYFSLDSANWTEAGKIENAAKDFEIKTVDFEPTLTRYVKLVFDDKYDVFASVGMINLYQDSTQIVNPMADVEYSTLNPTNGEVTATLTNITDNAIIADEDKTYTFTDNGIHNFILKDEDDNEFPITAMVDWIDKTPAEITIDYGDKTPTNEDVTVKLSFNEAVTITSPDTEIIRNNNAESDDNDVDDSVSIIFTENASYTVNYVDAAGNLGTSVIEVDWIDKDYPEGTFEYDIDEDTYKNVTVTLVPNEEVTILNNDGKLTYTFTENGSFTFNMQDAAGNIGQATAVVNWIKKRPDIKIVYNITSETTSNVIATISTSSNIRVLNNSGNTSYVFKENGSFTFEYVDEYGDLCSIEAQVTWIKKQNNIVPPSPINPVIPVNPTPDKTDSDNNTPNNKPVDNNTNINTNTNTNAKPNNTINNDNSNSIENPKEETKTNKKWISYGDKVKVEVNSNKELFLKYTELELDDTLLSKVGKDSSYFKIEIKNDINFKENMKDSIKVKYTIDDNKTVDKVYNVDKDGNLSEVEFTKSSGNSIEFEAEQAGEFIVKYKENKKVDKVDKNTIKDDKKEETKEDTKSSKVKVPFVIILITLIVFGGLNFAHFKFQRSKKNIKK